ncbi:hypothetical protein FRC11_007297 [Ceratobasidium sp. 423]|nr:hypothetical protein FRC11_007297 [Ceratobasidium sp. 423]
MVKSHSRELTDPFQAGPKGGVPAFLRKKRFILLLLAIIGVVWVYTTRDPAFTAPTGNIELAPAVSVDIVMPQPTHFDYPPAVRTKEHELEDLLQFFVAAPEASLPVDIDPSAELSRKSLVAAAAGRSATVPPVVVFSKTYCPYSKRAKNLLSSLKLEPAPYVVEVDLRSDSDTVKALLLRLTGHGTFPNILVSPPPRSPSAMPSFALPPQTRPRLTSTATSFFGSLSRKHQRLSAALLLFLSFAAFFSFLFGGQHDASSFIAYHRATRGHPTASYPLSRAFKETNRAIPQRKEVTITEPLNLTPAMELGALVAFLTDRAAENALPSTIDPQQQIPADVMLDFDTRSDFAQLEVDDLVQDTWMRNPIVVFSKVHSPQGRDLKKIFASYKLKPAPVIFDVDQREDAAVLEPVLYRLTGEMSLPIALLGGRSIGSPADIAKLHESGDLERAMNNVGVTMVPPKKKMAIPAPKLR